MFRGRRCRDNRIAITLAALLVAAGCTATTTGDPVTIPVQHVEFSREPSKPLVATLELPAGAGPFPAVIVLHGCNGIGIGSRTWAQRLNGWGYAVLLLDSFSARSVNTVCAPDEQSLVTPRDRVGDALSAALYLRTLPVIDGSRIAVLGLSHGGATAARITERHYEMLYPGLVKAAIDFYGSCGSPAEYGAVPLLVPAGENDTWGNPAASCTAFRAKLQSDQPVAVQTYPGVGHGFDNPAQRYTNLLGHSLGYDAAAANDSYQRVRSFLATWLAPARHAS